jgi:penicillin amidase
VNIDSLEILHQLGNGGSIREACVHAGLSVDKFDAWWTAELQRRLAAMDGVAHMPVVAAAEIRRDTKGVPHIYAEAEADLLMAYGYAMAQDRLFQMDYLRRRALGRLSEVLGTEAFEYDLVVRTVGLHRIAADEAARLPAETADLYEAFATGVNSFIEVSQDLPPIEFDLLDYRPEPWRPTDSLAVLGEFRWYLTGRFPVIAVPEMAKRSLGHGPLYEAFIAPEAGDETVLHPGEYATAGEGADQIESPLGGGDDGTGSNNWVIGPGKSATGAPILASDPHIAFGAPGCWYQAHLAGGRFNTAGASYAGAPGLIFGRNRNLSWGITNNISSQRDLYLERTDPGHPDTFLYDGSWEPAEERTERIRVRGEGVREETVRSSRNGPIVDRILPKFARDTGPVSLQWAGALPCAWPTSLLQSNVAGSSDEFEESLQGCVSPTLGVVYADREGAFGYRATGAIPIRKRPERGYRRGWDPEDSWQGLIPFNSMPALRNPERGWVATANNLPAPADFPYPLANMSPTGQRARRIRQLVESRVTLTRADIEGMQYDTLSLRAVEGVPPLVRVLETGNQRMHMAATILREWDCRMDANSTGAAIFEAFHHHWNTTVAVARFSKDALEMALGDPAAFVAGGIGTLSLRLLSDDHLGWFSSESARDEMACEAMANALDELTERIGSDMSAWTWGRLHTMRLPHALSIRGDLGTLLDRGGQPTGGNGFVVGNTGSGPGHAAEAGANYRIIVDLAETPAVLRSLDSAGQSGQPGSPNYADQTDDWLIGRYHHIPLEREDVVAATATTLTLQSQE